MNIVRWKGRFSFHGVGRRVSLPGYSRGPTRPGAELCPAVSVPLDHEAPLGSVLGRSRDGLCGPTGVGSVLEGSELGPGRAGGFRAQRTGHLTMEPETETDGGVRITILQ